MNAHYQQSSSSVLRHYYLSVKACFVVLFVLTIIVLRPWSRRSFAYLRLAPCYLHVWQFQNHLIKCESVWSGGFKVPSPGPYRVISLQTLFLLMCILDASLDLPSTPAVQWHCLLWLPSPHDSIPLLLALMSWLFYFLCFLWDIGPVLSCGWHGNTVSGNGVRYSVCFYPYCMPLNVEYSVQFRSSS